MEWKPIESAPHEGKFLVAEYAPTNWAYYVKTVRVYKDMPKIREQHLRYCTHWMNMLPEPNSDLCSDCLPIGNLTDETRCVECPHRSST